MENLNVLMARTIGAVLVIVGILGFLMTPTLVMWGVNPVHNVVHIATGALLVWAGWMATANQTRTTNRWLGIAYVAVALLGFSGILVPELLGMAADAAPHAGNGLHLVLGLLLAGAGWGTRDAAPDTTGTGPA